MQNNGAWMTSKDVAVTLDVHVRTLRNWIDFFSPYMVLQKNSQGHLHLSEQAFHLLIEIKRVKDTGVQTLKEVEDRLLAEGILAERKESGKENESPTHPFESSLNGIQEESVVERITELEDHINRQFYQTIQEITESYRQTAAGVETAVGSALETALEAAAARQIPRPSLPTATSSPLSDVHFKDIMRKMEEIEKKQENIRLEMRKMNFELQMLSVTEKRKNKHKKPHFFKWSLFRKAPRISSEY
ncbi:hypothetical protein [Aneurinibacillus terranovensis]|uniref:hypothetical protein n=1 Tax=Aneurinibacillus terranovensis TaxID=278991 RepID=UPI000412F83C|nr:hypothetical protein [Aneurinibacillus terranovensis]